MSRSHCALKKNVQVHISLLYFLFHDSRTAILPRMRAVLIDWLVEVKEILNETWMPPSCIPFYHMLNIVAGGDLHQQVHVQFDLLQETLYMAIYLIDRSFMMYTWY